MCQACADAVNAGATPDGSLLLRGFLTGAELPRVYVPRAPLLSAITAARQPLSVAFTSLRQQRIRFYRARLVQYLHSGPRAYFGAANIADDSDSDAPDSDTLVPIWDVHSHNFTSSADDVDLTLSGVPVFAETDTDVRIDRLAAMEAYGVVHMVVSGLIDNSTEGYLTDEQKLDDVTLHARDRFPDFILPFARGFSLEDSGSAAYVEGRLADDGFMGLGELFVHGYGRNQSEDSLETLVEILSVAAAYYVPVTVHWEFGSVNPASAMSSEEVFDQLIRVLDQFSTDNVLEYNPDAGGAPPVKLIIAHCGAGPSITPDNIDEYEAMLDILLDDDQYPNVFFDISGMQLPDRVEQLVDLAGPTLTELGRLLLRKMEDHPQRFLVGIDTENRYDEDTGGHAGWDRYADSVAGYVDYLAMEGILSEDNQKLVLFWNAIYPIYADPGDV